MGSIIAKKRLRSYTHENTEYYHFDDKKFYCKVVGVYDGDTITVIVRLNKGYYKYKVRMSGYDSPEMKPRLNNINREQIIADANRAKKVLSELILNKIVVIHVQNKTWDKYGRLLGVVYSQIPKRGITMKSYRFNVNEYMIERGLGYVYNGGTKKTLSQHRRGTA